jgi:hypothetical protein
MRTFAKAFRQNLTDAGGRSHEESMWWLLRRMQILVFDFTATGSASTELMQERAVRTLHSSHADQAGKLWTTLTDLSMEIALNGGERSRDSLVDELKKTYPLAGRRINLQAMVKLAEDSRLALLDIEDKISDVRLLREKRIDAVRNALETKRYVVKFQQRYVMSHRNVVNCLRAKAFGQFCNSQGDHPVSRSVLGAISHSWHRCG